jgi:hypothetical protein
VPKMITIGSVGFVPHICEIYSYQKCFPFFILREAHSPNGNSQLDHNASIDADFLKEVPFGGLDICKEICRGHICPQKLKKNSPLHKHEILPSTGNGIPPFFNEPKSRITSKRPHLPRKHVQKANIKSRSPNPLVASLLFCGAFIDRKCNSAIL